MADPRLVFDTNVLWHALLPSDDPTAIEVRASALYTYDRDDFPVGQTIDGVRISTPVVPPDLAQTSFDVE